MAVASDGEYIGSLSGGCIEAAVAEEALDALASGSARLVRFGAGSPYIDIRLPCGGSIDLLFTPHPDRAVIAKIMDLLNDRVPAALEISRTGVCAVGTNIPTGWRGERFVVAFTPRLRIIAFGQGEELTATAQLAYAVGALTEAFSPAQRDVRLLRAKGIQTDLLEFRNARPAIRSDPWTAIVFLFHDRDWEETLIPWALGLPRFYIGALGSRHSHAVRKAMLVAANVLSDDIRSLRSPIGLTPSTRDPSSLATSIIAEVVQEFAIDAALPLFSIVQDARVN